MNTLKKLCGVLLCAALPIMTVALAQGPTIPDAYHADLGSFQYHCSDPNITVDPESGPMIIYYDGKNISTQSQAGIPPIIIPVMNGHGTLHLELSNASGDIDATVVSKAQIVLAAKVKGSIEGTKISCNFLQRFNYQ